jgi:hypothetical protein
MVSAAVGNGDVIPVTAEGRIAAGILMILGVGSKPPADAPST